MIETNIPEIDVDELMEKIRAEVKQRKEEGNTPSRTIPSANFDSSPSRHGKIDRLETSHAPDPGKFEIKDQYHINDFLEYHGQQFVINAYRGILRRGPDSGGFQYFLEKLREGRMSKAEVLGRLRYSSEGRSVKVKISGLFWNFTIQSSFNIPFLGYLSRLMVGIVNLPLILRNIQALEGNTFTQLQQLRNDFNVDLSQLGPGLESKSDRAELGVLKNEVDAALENKSDRAELGVLKNEVDAALENKSDRAELGVLKNEVDAVFECKADRSELADWKGEVNAVLETKANKEQIQNITDQIREILKQTRDHKLNILDQQRRLMLLLEEARKRLPEPISIEQIEEMLTEEDQVLNAMYVSFEDRFRGTREDIKERQRIYLQYLEEAGFGSEDSPILDLGCGRGEWLELLKEKGFKAQGVDVNFVLVEECLKRGLDVVKADAIRFLRGIPARSLGVVTGFHIIEHLPLNLTIALLDEAMRVLKPGGMIILETPNPQNLLVGACDFYQDPTHIRPLHPLSQRFLLEYRGFSRSEILYLNPPEDFYRLPEDEAPQLAGRLNNLLTCARDYAILGYKA